jgi:hypothetical protein
MIPGDGRSGWSGTARSAGVLAEDLRQQDIKVATFDIKLRRVAFWRGSSADV